MTCYIRHVTLFHFKKNTRVNSIFLTTYIKVFSIQYKIRSEHPLKAPEGVGLKAMDAGGKGLAERPCLSDTYYHREILRPMWSSARGLAIRASSAPMLNIVLTGSITFCNNLITTPVIYQFDPLSTDWTTFQHAI